MPNCVVSVAMKAVVIFCSPHSIWRRFYSLGLVRAFEMRIFPFPLLQFPTLPHFYYYYYYFVLIFNISFSFYSPPPPPPSLFSWRITNSLFPCLSLPWGIRCLCVLSASFSSSSLMKYTVYFCFLFMGFFYMCSERHILVFNWSLCHVDHVLDFNLMSILETPD